MACLFEILQKYKHKKKLIMVLRPSTVVITAFYDILVFVSLRLIQKSSYENHDAMFVTENMSNK